MARLKQDDYSINSDIYDETNDKPYMAYAVEEINTGKILGIFQDKTETHKCAQMAVNPSVGGYGDVAIRGKDKVSVPFFQSAVDWLIA